MSKKILLADDSITIQKVISITFAGEDFDLTIVGDGNEAISKVREVRPNLIMADVAMPGKSGYEVCEIVKTDPELKDIPVLLLAGTFEPINEEEAERVGMDDYIVKPFESQELIDKVKGLLERQEVSKPLQGEEAIEAGIPTAEKRPTVAADIWEESDFVSPTQVEGAEQIGSGESEDIWSNTILEETVEEEQDEGIPQEEEFVEIDLSEGELKPISKEEETSPKLEPEELEAVEEEAVFTPESSTTKEEIKELEEIEELGEVEEIAEVEGPSMVSDADLSETSEEEAVIGSEASEGEDMIEGVEAMEELEEPVEPFTPPATELELEPELEVVAEPEPKVPVEAEPSIIPDTDAAETSEEEVVIGSGVSEDEEEIEGIEAVEELDEPVEPFAPPATDLEVEPEFEIVAEPEPQVSAELEPELEVVPEPEPQVSAELEPTIVSETELPETIEEEVVPPGISAVEEKIVEKTREVVASEIAGNMSILKERIEEIVTRVSKEVIEEVAWEIIPDMVEKYLKEEMRKIKEAIISLK